MFRDARARRLVANGRALLVVACVFVALLVAALAGAGGWYRLHTWIAGVVLVLVGFAVACLMVAPRVEGARLVPQPDVEPAPAAVAAARPPVARASADDVTGVAPAPVRVEGHAA